VALGQQLAVDAEPTATGSPGAPPAPEEWQAELDDEPDDRWPPGEDIDPAEPSGAWAEPLGNPPREGVIESSAECWSAQGDWSPGESWVEEPEWSEPEPTEAVP